MSRKRSGQGGYHFIHDRLDVLLYTRYEIIIRGGRFPGQKTTVTDIDTFRNNTDFTHETFPDTGDERNRHRAEPMSSQRMADLNDRDNEKEEFPGDFHSRNFFTVSFYRSGK
jgi:hypothetical protein